MGKKTTKNVNIQPLEGQWTYMSCIRIKDTNNPLGNQLIMLDCETLPCRLVANQHQDVWWAGGSCIFQAKHLETTSIKAYLPL